MHIMPSDLSFFVAVFRCPLNRYAVIRLRPLFWQTVAQVPEETGLLDNSNLW